MLLLSFGFLLAATSVARAAELVTLAKRACTPTASAVEPPPSGVVCGEQGTTSGGTKLPGAGAYTSFTACRDACLSNPSCVAFLAPPKNLCVLYSTYPTFSAQRLTGQSNKFYYNRACYDYACPAPESTVTITTGTATSYTIVTVSTTTTSDVTYTSTYEAVQPPPTTFICGWQGTVANPASYSATTYTDSTGFSRCQDTCYSDSAKCDGFNYRAYGPSSGACTFLSSFVYVGPTFTFSSNNLYWWNTHCFTATSSIDNTVTSTVPVTVTTVPAYTTVISFATTTSTIVPPATKR